MPTISSTTTLNLTAGQAMVFLAGSGVGNAVADPGGRDAKYSIGPQQTAVGPFSTTVSVDVTITSGSIDYRVDTDGDLRDQEPAIAVLNEQALQLTPSGLRVGGVAPSAEQAAAVRSSIGIAINELAALVNSETTKALCIDSVPVVPLSGGASALPVFSTPNIWVRRPYIRSITEFGAVGDNTERKLSDIFSTLSQAQQFFQSASSLDDLLDWAAFQTAIDTIRATGKPGYLECGEEARYRFKKPVVFNPSLDCSQLVHGINIIGPGGYRAYDSGTEYPVTITVTARDWETSDGAFDMRASQMCKISGFGLYGFTQGSGSINQLVRIGAEGCSNAASIVRVGAIDDCLLYGSAKSIRAYLTSGLCVSRNNISRASVNGLELNACGDAEVTRNLFNNIGPMLTADIPANASSGLGASYHDGSALAMYGGGGNNFVTENRFEVCNKGLTAYNMQGLRVMGGFVDKCREFGIGIATGANISGTTNIAYQPRSIQIEGIRFIANGWNSTYNSHLYFENTGSSNNMKVALIGNVFASGGPNAIDNLPDVYASQQKIFGNGPYRSIRANCSGSGSSIEIASSGNQYSGGSTDYTVDAANSAGVVFDSSSDLFDKPCVLANGTIRGAKKRITVSVSWTPGSISAGAGLSFGSITLPNATFDTALSVTPPSSLANLIAQPYVTVDGTGNIRLHNGTGGAVTAPSGTWKITYEVDKWLP